MAAQGGVDEVMDVYLSGIEYEAASAIDLPPGSGNLDLIGRRLCFLGDDGVSRNVFRLKEKWRIVLEFELVRPLPHVVGAVGLWSVEGVPILTYFSKPKDLQAGHYRVEFPVDIPLRGCRLNFVVGLSSNDHAMYHVRGIGNVTISEVAEGAQPFRVSGKGGVLLTECTSEIEPVSSGERF